MIRIIVFILLVILIYLIIRDLRKGLSSKKEVRRQPRKDENDIDRSRIEDAKFKEIENDESENKSTSDK